MADFDLSSVVGLMRIDVYDSRSASGLSGLAVAPPFFRMRELCRVFGCAESISVLAFFISGTTVKLLLLRVRVAITGAVPVMPDFEPASILCIMLTRSSLSLRCCCSSLILYSNGLSYCW